MVEADFLFIVMSFQEIIFILKFNNIIMLQVKMRLKIQKLNDCVAYRISV